MLIDRDDINKKNVMVFLPSAFHEGEIFFDFSLTVKAAPHECVIRTCQPKT